MWKPGKRAYERYLWLPIRSEPYGSVGESRRRVPASESWICSPPMISAVGNNYRLDLNVSLCLLSLRLHQMKIEWTRLFMTAADSQSKSEDAHLNEDNEFE